MGLRKIRRRILMGEAHRATGCWHLRCVATIGAERHEREYTHRDKAALTRFACRWLFKAQAQQGTAHYALRRVGA
jgi:hypothetical protein